ncbi:MAG: hypothetical protein HQK89_12755 [Nitrospirae bacterium]|nr:hypothetical protein [Nitrospirota bacterium]
MKSGVLKLLAVVIGINVFFAYIGWFFLPQSESRPPKTTKIEKGITRDELVTAGEGIVFGKGQCMTCHPMKPETGMRAPAISTIGADMVKSAKGCDTPPETFVFESLVNPGKYVEKGFDNMMPPVNKPPTSLSEGELIAVAAFLQSKGSNVTVSYPESVALLKAAIEKAEKQGGGK